MPQCAGVIALPAVDLVLAEGDHLLILASLDGLRRIEQARAHTQTLHAGSPGVELAVDPDIAALLMQNLGRLGLELERGRAMLEDST